MVRSALTIFLIGEASAAGAADIEVYGKLVVTLQDSDEATQRQFELQNNSSRVGVRGEKPLNADLASIASSAMPSSCSRSTPRETSVEPARAIATRPSASK